MKLRIAKATEPAGAWRIERYGEHYWHLVALARTRAEARAKQQAMLRTPTAAQRDALTAPGPRGGSDQKTGES